MKSLDSFFSVPLSSLMKEDIFAFRREDGLIMLGEVIENKSPKQVLIFFFSPDFLPEKTYYQPNAENMLVLPLRQYVFPFVLIPEGSLFFDTKGYLFMKGALFVRLFIPSLHHWVRVSQKGFFEKNFYLTR